MQVRPYAEWILVWTLKIHGMDLFNSKCEWGRERERNRKKRNIGVSDSQNE